MLVDHIMNSRIRVAIPVAALVAILAGGACAEEAPSFSKSGVFFELNHSDGDLGIHAKIDGDGWRGLALDDPAGNRVLDIQVKGNLALQGLTELFTESAEPSFDELKPKDFFARFPEGTYAISDHHRGPNDERLGDVVARHARAARQHPNFGSLGAPGL